MKRLTLTQIRDVLPPDSDIRDIVNDDTQMFDFGTETALNNDADLIANLWHEKLLRPPFDRCVFTFTRPGGGMRIYLCAAYGVKVLQPDGAIDDTTVLAIITQHGSDQLKADMWQGDAITWFKTTGGTDIYAGGTPLCEVDGETDETFKNFTLWCVGRFMRLCMMLNTKGVDQRHEPAPAKLNAKRARTGKPPICAVTYVNLSRVKTTGGTGEGSPKAMHWRRGHIRRYDDGSVTWVRDCIVKADGDLKKRERYQVGVRHAE